MQAAPLLGHPTHHDDDEPRPPGPQPVNGGQPPSSRPEAHQREAAVEGLISLSQLPPLVAPSQPPPLRPLPLRKRKPPMPPSGPLHKQEQRPPSTTRPAIFPSPSGLLLQQRSSSSSPPPPPPPSSEEAAPPLVPLASLGRVMAPYYLTRAPPPSSPPPPPLKRLRAAATATLPPDGAGAFGLDSSCRRLRLRRSSGSYYAQQRVIISSPTGPEEEAPDRAPPSPATTTSTTTTTTTVTSKLIAREAGPQLEPASPPRPSGAMAEAASQTPAKVKEEEEMEKGDDEQVEKVEREGGGIEQENQVEEEEEAEERERRAVERCLDLGVERNVVEALSTAGVSAERIVELILSEDKEQREGIIRGTGLSKNYIMKLQRRALRTSAHLQLPSPLAHSFHSGLVLHVLFDSHDRALFIKKELCRLLNMKGTTFSYWKKKADVSDIDTSQDFRLMDKCRSIFGGRSTYTLYSAEQMLAILQCMQRSRQKNCFTNVSELTALITSYSCYPLPHNPPSPLSLLLPSQALAGAYAAPGHLEVDDTEDMNENGNDADKSKDDAYVPLESDNGVGSSPLPTTETARRPFTTADPR